MKTIQPPTDEEKKAYWLHVKTKTLFATGILTITVVIAILVYLFINHYDTIVFYGVPTLIVCCYHQFYPQFTVKYTRHGIKCINDIELDIMQPM